MRISDWSSDVCSSDLPVRYKKNPYFRCKIIEKKQMSQSGTTKSFDLGDGRTISIETGRLAKQADGSVVVRMGDAMLLATVVSSKEIGRASCRERVCPYV